VQTLYCCKDQTTGRFKAVKLKGEEVALIDQVGVADGQVQHQP
jgi:hypothetical protein